MLVGSYASIARMLDEMAAVPGVQGVMMTFDDFVIGMEQFGTRILPLMRCRERRGPGGVMAAVWLRRSPRPALSRKRDRVLCSGAANRCGVCRASASRAWVVSWLQVGPLALILVVLFALPTLLFLVVSFFDYDRVGIYPAFLLDNYHDLLTTPATCGSMSAR